MPLTVVWALALMPRPENIADLIASGGVAGQMKEAAQEELQHWYDKLQRFVSRDNITPEERSLAEKELRYCKRKLKIEPTVEEITAHYKQQKAQANARVKRHYQRKKLAASQVPQTKPAWQTEAEEDASNLARYLIDTTDIIED
jgi:hypothetical protein